MKNFTELSSSVNVTVHKNHLDTKKYYKLRKSLPEDSRC